MNTEAVAKSMGVMVHVMVDAQKAMVAFASVMSAFNDLTVAIREHIAIQSYRSVMARSWNCGGRWRKWLKDV